METGTTFFGRIDELPRRLLVSAPAVRLFCVPGAVAGDLLFKFDVVLADDFIGERFKSFAAIVKVADHESFSRQLRTGLDETFAVLKLRADNHPTVGDSGVDDTVRLAVRYPAADDAAPRKAFGESHIAERPQPNPGHQ